MESGTHAEVLSRLSIIIRGVGKQKSSNLSTKGLIIQLSEKEKYVPSPVYNFTIDRFTEKRASQRTLKILHK